MAARNWLIAYGYQLEADGRYRRPGKLTQVWQELEDGKGWLRFDPDGQGNEIPEVYTIASPYQGTSGLNKIHHPGCFVWVWPEEEVEKIYKAAVEAAGTTALPAAESPLPTVDEVAAMQNAQAGQANAAQPAAKEKKHHWWD